MERAALLLLNPCCEMLRGCTRPLLCCSSAGQGRAEPSGGAAALAIGCCLGRRACHVGLMDCGILPCHLAPSAACAYNAWLQAHAPGRRPSLPRSIFVGLLIGWAVAALLRTPRQFRSHALAAIAFGNVCLTSLVYFCCTQSSLSLHASLASLLCCALLPWLLCAAAVHPAAAWVLRMSAFAAPGQGSAQRARPVPAAASLAPALQVGNLPLVFVGPLCRDQRAVFFRSLGDSCEHKSIAYIAFDIAGGCSGWVCKWVCECDRGGAGSCWVGGQAGGWVGAMGGWLVGQVGGM